MKLTVEGNKIFLYVCIIFTNAKVLLLVNHVPKLHILALM